MPIYEYELEDGGDCRTCGGRFDLRRPIDREPLKACPLCQRPVRKLVSSVNTPRLTKPLSVSAAKSAGFQVLKKRDQGTYEKL